MPKRDEPSQTDVQKEVAALRRRSQELRTEMEAIDSRQAALEKDVQQSRKKRK